VRADEDYDPVSGMPRLGAVPVSITPLAAGDAPTATSSR